jgi:type I restriction enzyme R subunit
VCSSDLTIIFARNHLHALFIEQQFNKNYPEYGGSFLRVIDNYESKAQDLLDRFTDVLSEQEPQIAVSVDMMDTGIDAPRVVNLVFFKPIRSSAKFWQMIGRGTRLFPDLFGPGEDKEEFLIFDYCGNFEFFEEFPDGTQTRAAKPITQQIFEGRLKVAEQIKLIPEVTEDDIHIRTTYLDKLCSSIGALDHSRYALRPHLEHVIEYSRRQRWDMLSISDVSDINTSLFHLIPVEKGDDELARRFDMLIIALQLSMLAGSDIEKYSSNVYGIAKSLEKKTTIPQVSCW